MSTNTNSTENSIEEYDNADVSILQRLNKNQLITYITGLRNRESKLIEKVKDLELSKRIFNIEVSHLKSLQYQRRDSIEIHNFPTNIPDSGVENKCIEILENLGVSDLTNRDIHAAHSLKNNKNVIIKFVNRKFADKSLHCKSKTKLLDKDLLGLGQNPIYINESLCRPMNYLMWKVRIASKSKKIDKYNLWKGKLTVTVNGMDHDISHIDNLIELELAESKDRVDFFK